MEIIMSEPSDENLRIPSSDDEDKVTEEANQGDYCAPSET
jgi:hypothetical protein